ncbi:MAG: hypothetical protein ACREYE_12200, partial [Gammaproteobacteria bacterium]
HVRVYPPVSLRLPSAVLPALLKRQLTISRTSAEFMQAYRKDTNDLKRIKLARLLSPNGTVWQVTETHQHHSNA